MIAIIVERCRECPFVSAGDDDDTGIVSMCTAPSFDPAEERARVLPDQHLRDGETQPPPPDWCPLREADRLVTLRRPR